MIDKEFIAYNNDKGIAIQQAKLKARINSIDETKINETEKEKLLNNNYFNQKLTEYIVKPFLNQYDISSAIKTLLIYSELDYNEIVDVLKNNINGDKFYTTKDSIDNLLSEILGKTSFSINVQQALNNRIVNLTEESVSMAQLMFEQKGILTVYSPFMEKSFTKTNGEFNKEDFINALNESKKIISELKTDKDTARVIMYAEIKINGIYINEHTNERLFKDYLESIQTEIVNVEDKFVDYQNGMNSKREEIIRLKAFVNYITNNAKPHIEIPRNSVIEMCTKMLSMSPYPFLWKKEMDISYNPSTKTLITDYALPLRNEINILDEKGKQVNEKEGNKLYNNVLYSICLRTIAEIFLVDVSEVDYVTFNGFITDIDKSTGNIKTTCIMSLSVSKKEFNTLNLAKVNAKECFKKLKGVGASELNSITPVTPIMVIDKEDKRFIDGYKVLENVSSGTNIAAIDWQDFENLIREVFEKEFSASGGEVKITQTSHDGGVDAVAFDPDPIRGGKIIIQAKRYTNVVGVSAVRDLYGTLINEGANSGVLVTTSDYGAEAYEFAKGKPIKLLNGSELLGLLKKQGYNAYINLQEAKDYFKSI